jgi:hypothetical protein
MCAVFDRPALAARFQPDNHAQSTKMVNLGGSPATSADDPPKIGCLGPALRWCGDLDGRSSLALLAARSPEAE